jgi:hypothetical protein
MSDLIQTTAARPHDAQPRAPRKSHGLSDAVSGWLLSTPLALVLLFFLVLPIVMIVIVSFWGATEFSIYPGLPVRQLRIPADLAGHLAVFSTPSNTLSSPGLHAGDRLHGRLFPRLPRPHADWQIALFLLCTIPFWTSNIIRMISWIPFLGRNGIANSTLISMGVIDEPLEWLLFSDFSVILAFVHLYTLFMVVPIFNTMMRIDKSLIEAAATRRERMADADQCHHPADQARHHDRLDLRRDAGDGRLHHRALHVGLAIGQCRPADLQRYRAAAIPVGSGDRGGAADHRADGDRHPAALRRYPEGAVTMEKRPRSFYVSSPPSSACSCCFSTGRRSPSRSCPSRGRRAG